MKLWIVHDAGRFGKYGDVGPSICAVQDDGTCQPLFEICGPAGIDECVANAYLAAAAPDLLSVCERLIAAHDIGDVDVFSVVAAARKAVAKAEGP